MAEGLCVRDLACTRGGRPVFAGLDFDAAPGEVVQVRGANGSGKSSLLRLLCGLLEPAAGAVHWRQRRIFAADADFAAEVAYIGHADGMSGDLTVRENLRFSLRIAGGADAEPDCREVLRRLRLADREHALVRQLSQGQRRRLGLARVLLSRRPLWLLDEPCAGLDAEGEKSFGEDLAGHARRGGMAVVTTHGATGRNWPCARTLDLDGPDDAGRCASHHRA